MKFAGKVGFWLDDVEVRPSVYKPQIVEMDYTGDVLQSRQGFQSTGDQNQEFKVTNRISILSDIFAQQHSLSIKYVVWNGQKIAVKSVDVGYPRITLELGGVWNGKTAN